MSRKHEWEETSIPTGPVNVPPYFLVDQNGYVLAHLPAVEIERIAQRVLEVLRHEMEHGWERKYEDSDVS